MSQRKNPTTFAPSARPSELPSAVCVASVVDSNSSPIDIRVTSNATPGTKMNTDQPNGTVEKASVRTVARRARLSVGRPERGDAVCPVITATRPAQTKNIPVAAAAPMTTDSITKPVRSGAPSSRAQNSPPSDDASMTAATVSTDASVAPSSW